MHEADLVVSVISFISSQVK